MQLITAGRDKGWCRCERCGCLLVPDVVLYGEHLEQCDGSGRDSPGVEDVPWACYADLIADVPLPTQQQKDNFIDYVSHVRCQGLSPYPPGIPVHFYLDMFAGCDRNGAPFVVTGDNSPPVLTDAYRNAFGYLSHSTDRKNNPRFLIPLGRKFAWPPTRVAPASIQPWGRIAGEATHHTLVYGLPEEIFASGETWLTGAVHLCSASGWGEWSEDRQRGHMSWPEESGGRDTLEAIFSRCRYLRQPGAKREYMPRRLNMDKEFPSNDLYWDFQDPVLFELLAPERRRQQKAMLAAIDRVCSLIESQRNGRTPA